MGLGSVSLLLGTDIKRPSAVPASGRGGRPFGRLSRASWNGHYPSVQPKPQTNNRVGAWITGIVAVAWLVVSGASCWLYNADGTPAFLPALHNVLDHWLGFC
jgi:hypothetical protein